MQGKLTQQLNSDSSVDELLDNIKIEREQSIKQKIAKEKNVEPITEDDIPFEIPSNWRWIRFGDMVNYRMGKTPERSDISFWGKDFPRISIADMIENGHISNTKEGVTQKAMIEKFKNTISPKGTMLMSFKLTVGRVSILDIDAVHNEAIISIFPYADESGIIQKYLFCFLPVLTEYGDTNNAIKGRTLNDTSIANLLVPVPPIEEQQRIVDRVEGLMKLCKGLNTKME